RRPGASRWGRGQFSRPPALRTSLNMLRRIASEHEAQAALFADTMPQGVTPRRANRRIHEVLMSVWTARSHEANFDSHPVSLVGEAEPARALANSQRHEQSLDNAICNVSSGGSGDNHRSVVPEHDRLLTPAVASAPLRRTRSLPIIGLAGFILGVASTAILTNVPRVDFQPWTRWALGETFKLASSLAHPWRGTQENPAIPRLISQPSQG